MSTIFVSVHVVGGTYTYHNTFWRCLRLDQAFSTVAAGSLDDDVLHTKIFPHNCCCCDHQIAA